ncbi:MAG: hypothetical protein IJW99_00875 [Clostridia bacterium]|nr:hypothetical protein [Clostridia bacterium]
MNFKKILISAVATTLLLSAFSSCGKTEEGTQVEQTSNTTEETTTVSAVETTEFVPEQTQDPLENATFLKIVEGKTSSFKVIRGDDASDEVGVASIHLRKALNDATGANIGITSDIVKPQSDGSMEILVGKTNRAISKEFQASLTGYSFGIKVTENGIVIAATHEDFIPLAVDYFMEHYMENGDLVKMTDSSYEISTAASVICRGELADLTNIRRDTQYATVSELVATLNKDGNFKALQGGCVTKDFAYMAVLNTTDYDTQDAGCYIYKLSTDNWKIVKRSGVLMLAHANDITYHEETNTLYVAHCYVDSTKISIIDADTLKLVGTIHTDIGVYALDYHAPTDTFIGGRGKSGTIFFRYASNGKRLIQTGMIKPISTQMVTQGICRDDNYAYHVMFSTDANEPYNTIIIYDLEAKSLAHYVRLSISDQEPENISLVDGAFYIGCNSKSGSNKLDIYKSILYEFDFNTVERCS